MEDYNLTEALIIGAIFFVAIFFAKAQGEAYMHHDDETSRICGIVVMIAYIAGLVYAATI